MAARGAEIALFVGLVGFVTDVSASAEGAGMFAGWREILVQERDLERARELLAAPARHLEPPHR